jgi:hypothetical protein
MSPEADRREAARKSGEEYGTRAADLCLILLSTGTGERAIEEHIKNLARNIREQAGRYAADLGEELASDWKVLSTWRRRGKAAAGAAVT